jgi:hypothetical protein
MFITSIISGYRAVFTALLVLIFCTLSAAGTAADPGGPGAQGRLVIFESFMNPA